MIIITIATFFVFNKFQSFTNGTIPRIISTLVVLLVLTRGVNSFGSGAPESVCESLMPSHGVPPQQSPSPYQVTTSNTFVTKGGQTSVTLSGSLPFIGFFIRVIQNDKYIGGTFQQNDLGKLRCSNQGMTHSSSDPKFKLVAVWTAPADIQSSPMQFEVTVVQQKQVFWTKVKSADITISLLTSNDTSMKTETTTSSSFTLSNPNSQDPNSAFSTISIDPDCGKSKGCYHNCKAGDPCSYFFSWTYEIDQVHFEFLYHSSSSADQWIALGLSRDTIMGDDSVLECVAEDGQVHVRTSYNNGQANEYPGDKSAAISDAKGSVIDGVLACSFIRKSSYPEEKRVFDLSLPYYLMVATGTAVSGNKLPHSYEKLPEVSAEKVSLQQVASISGSRNPFYPLVKAHGTIMTLAWMFFASCGLVIAKHGRSMFNNCKPFGIHVWFHIHRFCMVITALLTILGCVIIVIESKGYSVIPETPGKAYRVLHPPLGLILVIVTLVNPLIALFRPDPKSPSRPVFRWSHWGIGIFAWATSFVLIVIGLDLNKSQGEVEAIYVVFGFIAYQLAIDIVIRVTESFCGCFKSGCCESKHRYNINMAELSSNGLSRETTGDAPDDDDDTLFVFVFGRIVIFTIRYSSNLYNIISFFYRKISQSASSWYCTWCCLRVSPSVSCTSSCVTPSGHFRLYLDKMAANTRASLDLQR
ncbi:unnamed protein product [Candidula unifasciata]|uniref:Ferric-chelate reductase 1 n=1 Tax=Candidula unifasciata TaxID=100452 RepID=A0A8S3YNL5_9EUPU|nr:unnamed protein product [Candidula unifasciata]